MKYTYFLIFILLSLISCNPSEKKPKEKQTVKVGYLNMVSSLTHFVAIEKGYYNEQNIKVKGNPIKSSNLIAQELTTGHIDAGIELAITPLLKHLEKSPGTVKIFSTSKITTDNGFDAILVKKDAPITRLKDLSGKKVGGFPGSTAKVSFMQLFEKKYPDLAPPKFIPLTPNLHIQSLETGDIDALFAYEPILSTGKVKYQFREIFPSVYGTQFMPSPIGVAAVNQKWLEENPENAQRFFNAINNALNYIYAHPKEAKKILARATKIDKEIAQNMNIMPMSKSNEIDIKNLDGYLKLLRVLGEIEATPTAQELCIRQ